MVKGFLCLVLLLASAHLAEAQQPAGKIPRIGYLTAAPLSGLAQQTDAFRQGLRALGYVEGKNIILKVRCSDGNSDALRELAVGLVQLKVDVIVSAGPGSTRPAKEATNTIPIVMAQDNDPVANGFVASLARPGGNITGLSTLSAQLSGKRLELLKEVLPRLSRVAVFDNSTAGNSQVRKETEDAARALGLKLQYLDIRSSNDIATAFQEAKNGRADAVLMLPNPIHFSGRTRIATLAIKNRLPAIYGRPEYVDAGGLMNYGVSFSDLDRRAAIYVDKILKGAKPAELPVEQPTKFEFIINLKTAKQIGVTIPPNVLARADKVIK